MTCTSRSLSLSVYLEWPLVYKNKNQSSKSTTLCLYFENSPPSQFIVIDADCLPKVQDRKSLDGEGQTQSEALGDMWVLRALVLCKLRHSLKGRRET